MDYTTKTRVVLEKLLDMELHSPQDRSLFYEDHAPSFSQILFYGQEWSLWQLELLVFAFVDMLATDYVLAAVITFSLSRVRHTCVHTHTHTHHMYTHTHTMILYL